MTISDITISIRIDNPEAHNPVRFAGRTWPIRIEHLEITYLRDALDPTGWWANPCVLHWKELEGYTGPVDDPCNHPDQPFPDWVRQLVADHTPGTVTDTMITAALQASRAIEDSPRSCMRAALTAALHAQIGAQS